MSTGGHLLFKVQGTRNWLHNFGYFDCNPVIRPLPRVGQGITGLCAELEPSYEYPGPPIHCACLGVRRKASSYPRVLRVLGYQFSSLEELGGWIAMRLWQGLLPWKQGSWKVWLNLKDEYSIG